MKIIIATPKQMGFEDDDIGSDKCPGYQPIFCDNSTPSEIRAAIAARIATEEYNRDNNPGAKEYRIVTINHTVLNEVQHPDAKTSYGISYDDCQILIDGKLIPLTEWKSESWLAHFSLGDVISRYL